MRKGGSLKSSVEKLENDRVKITVVLDEQEVTKAIDDTYADIAKNVKISGFRKGKVPRPVIDSHIGQDTVLNQARDALVSESYPHALNELRLRVILAPETGELAEMVPGKAFEYSAETMLKPEMEISPIDDVEVVAPPLFITDAEVEESIRLLRDRYATYLAVGDRGLQMGDMAVLDWTATADGLPFEGGEAGEVVYDLGGGMMPPEFDQALLGVKAGETAEVEFLVPRDFVTETIRGKLAHFNINVQEIMGKELPELDDRFATEVGGFDTAEEMRADLRKTLENKRREERRPFVAREIRERVRDKLIGEPPAQMVFDRANQIARDFEEQLDQRDVRMDQYLAITGQTIEQVREEVMKQATSTVKEDLAIDAVARLAGIEVTQEQIDEEIAEAAKQDGEGEDKIRETLDVNGTLPIVIEGIMRREALQWLMDHVKITELSEDQLPGQESAEKTPAKKAAAKKAASKKPASGKKETTPKKSASTKAGKTAAKEE